jgi:hypothetical protein
MILVLLVLLINVVGFSAAGSAARAYAAVQPLFQLEPSVGAANGSVVAIGTGFAAGQVVTVSNETTGAAVCSTTAALDGTFSCHGLAGAVPGTVSAIGVGTSTGTYRAAGPSEIATVAGGGYGDGGPATNAVIGQVQTVASDAAGDVFFNDTTSNTVRRIDASTGVITTVAGVSLDIPGPDQSAGYGGDGGPATLAQLNQPQGLAVDQQGDLFIADFGNNRVREVSAATGIITTVAGDGTAGSSGDGGPATSAELNQPEGLAVDSHGDLFIGDAGNCRIREVSAATGVITTVAGSTCGYGGDGGPATSAVLANHLPGLAVDQNGDLFIADYYNNRVREVAAATGTIATIAGNGIGGYSGDNGPATQAELWLPSGVTLTAGGGLLIADSNSSVIRQVNLATGIITTVAGDGSYGTGGDGGPATSASLSATMGVATDQSGDFFIADNIADINDFGTGLDNVRRVDGSTGIITTLAADYHFDVCSRGSATMAFDSGVFGVAVDSGGDIFFTEQYANVICEVDASTGIVSVIAGTTGHGGFSGDGGPATSALLSEPFGLAVHGSDLYIADYQNFRVRQVDLTTGIITTVAGDGTNGDTGNGGPATSAEISDPTSVAVDPQGNVYILGGGSVREVNAATGIISSVASAGGPGLAGGIAADNHGHLFIATGGLAELNLATSQLTDIPGAGGDSVAADTSGNVFVAGQNNYLVQRVHLATGTVTTIAGTGQEGYSGDGGPATEARVWQPMGVAVDASDDIFIGELWSGRVREVVGGPALRITSAPASGPATGAATAGPITVTEEDAFGNAVAAPAGGTTVTLRTTSPTGVFAATSAGPGVTAVTIPVGASSATFFYGDTIAGTPWLTASAAGYGSAAQQATIKVLPPTQPLDVRASAGNASATVSFTAPASDGGSPITSYTVAASPGGKTAAGSASPITVTGLTNGTSYTFTVTATNAAGTGPASAASAAVTPATVPGAPANVTAVAGNAKVTLSWQAPTANGGSALTGYDVYVGTASGQESATPVNASPITTTSYAVGSLTDGTKYYFIVKAANAVGVSTASSQVAAVPSPVNFAARPGAATDISVGANGSVWVVGTASVSGGHPIYRWNGSKWVTFAGAAVAIAVDPHGNPWIVNSSHKIYYWNGSKWVTVTGAATDISVGANGAVWVVGTASVSGGHPIYRWSGSRWVSVAGAAVAIAVDPHGNPWIVSSSHQISYWNGSKWVAVTGAATDISVGANGAVWDVGADSVAGGHSVYERTGSSWTKSSGTAVKIAVDQHGNPWIVNSSHQIFFG